MLALPLLFITQPDGKASAIRKASINTVKTSRNTAAKIMPRVTEVISAVETDASISERLRDITAAKTTGLPKQPRALLKAFLQEDEVQNTRAKNIRAIILAEITIPVVLITPVNGNRPKPNKAVNIAAVINAKNAAVAILNVRLIKFSFRTVLFLLPITYYEKTE